MKFLKILCTSYFVLSPTVFAQDLQCKNDYNTIISKDIIALGTAIETENLQYIEDKTDSSVLNYLGGKESMHSMLMLTMDMFIKNKIHVAKIETQPPQESYIFDNKEICFVPKQLTLQINGQIRQSDKTFMVAVRQLPSNEWKYIDGVGLKRNPDMLYKLFPEFPKNIKVALLDQK